MQDEFPWIAVSKIFYWIHFLEYLLILRGKSLWIYPKSREFPSQKSIRIKQINRFVYFVLIEWWIDKKDSITLQCVSKIKLLCLFFISDTSKWSDFVYSQTFSSSVKVIYISVSIRKDLIVTQVKSLLTICTLFCSDYTFSFEKSIQKPWSNNSRLCYLKKNFRDFD